MQSYHGISFKNVIFQNKKNTHEPMVWRVMISLTPFSEEIYSSSLAAKIGEEAGADTFSSGNLQFLIGHIKL